jgi:hypothetical protein
MHSVTLGRNTKAPSFAETVVGQFNSEYTPLSPTVWNDADRLFVIGNGVDEKHKSNALTILKNGNTTVGGSLTTEGNATVTGNLGATGNVFANGNVTANGKLKVNGSKGIVRTISGDQLKTLEVPVVVNTTISGGATANISFTFSEAFSVAPAVYVGNVTSGGGFAEVVMSVAAVTTTGGKLFIYNPKSGSQSPNFTVKMVALGKE